ncbi:MAG: DHH family phosphoesterase [Proteobacteria bacterium]|nr:DHH family phosphoesterase [Pseudomonadota bacterium]
MNEKTKLFIDKINAVKNIVIVTHHNPDGDAMGTSLAMAEIIRDNFGKSAPPVIHTGTAPSFLNWLPHRDEWVKNPADVMGGAGLSQTGEGDLGDKVAPPIFDLAIMIDTSGGNTGAESMAIFNRAADSVKFDHHPVSPDIAKLNFHQHVNSTAQVLLEVIKDAGWRVSIDTAVNLYAAIASDTGGFRWADDAGPFTAAAECVRLGADPRKNDELSNLSNRDNIVENAKIIEQAEFLFDGRLAISAVSYADYPKLDGKGGHAMDWLRMIDTVECVALLKEQKPGIVHVSFRSRHMDVNKIAASLGGGGHVNASGARLETDIPTAKQMVIKAFSEAI